VGYRDITESQNGRFGRDLMLTDISHFKYGWVTVLAHFYYFAILLVLDSQGYSKY